MQCRAPCVGGGPKDLDAADSRRKGLDALNAEGHDVLCIHIPGMIHQCNSIHNVMLVYTRTCRLLKKTMNLLTRTLVID